MKSILQVEDDPNDVFFLRHAMQKVGVTNPINVVSDGQEAIDYLRGAGKFADRQQFPRPALILLDLKLPHVMGLDVLRWIRQEHKSGVVVVMLTASGEDADVRTAYRLGANGFLVKPSEAHKYNAMVTSIRDFWLIHNTVPEFQTESPMASAAVSHADPSTPTFSARRPLPTNASSHAQPRGEASL